MQNRDGKYFVYSNTLYYYPFCIFPHVPSYLPSHISTPEDNDKWITYFNKCGYKQILPPESSIMEQCLPYIHQCVK
jgi:hypothetical protein